MGHDRLLNRLVVSALVLAHQLPNSFVLIVIDFVLHVLRPIEVALGSFEEVELGLGFVLVLRDEALLLLVELHLWAGSKGGLT